MGLSTCGLTHQGSTVFPCVAKLEKYCFRTQRGTPGNSWEGVSPGCLNPDPINSDKNVIFHTRFQTWQLKFIPVFRPGLKAEIMSWLLTLKRQQNYFYSPISNSDISLSPLFIWFWNDKYVYTLTQFPRNPYPIPEQNKQSVYQFSYRKGAKTISFGAAQVPIWLIQGSTPPVSEEARVATGRQKEGNGKTFECDKRDRDISYVFFNDLHLK